METKDPEEHERQSELYTAVSIKVVLSKTVDYERARDDGLLFI